MQSIHTIQVGFPELPGAPLVSTPILPRTESSKIIYRKGSENSVTIPRSRP